MQFSLYILATFMWYEIFKYKKLGRKTPNVNKNLIGPLPSSGPLVCMSSLPLSSCSLH